MSESAASLGRSVRGSASSAPGVLATTPRLPTAIALIVLVIGALGMIAPFLWMLGDLDATRDAGVRPAAHWVPWPLRPDNYEAAVTGPVPLLKNMFNSAVIAIAIALGQLITCPLAGYAFARLRFPGRNVLFVVLLTSLMVPIHVTIIPMFVLMRNLGLVNSPLSLILPGITGAFGVFLMRQFFLTLPAGDARGGSHRWRRARSRTTVRSRCRWPSRPSPRWASSRSSDRWNAYFVPLIFLNNIETTTMPIALVLMLGPNRTGNVPEIMAATTIAIIPALIVFLVAQRWIMESLTQSAVKG